LFNIWQYLSQQCRNRLFFANKLTLFCGVAFALLTVIARKSVSIINSRALDAPLMSGNGKIIFVLQQNDMSYLLAATDNPKRAVVCSAGGNLNGSE